MIDFHSHILPQIDDGSSGMEETINMLKEAKEVGFTKIISTSHYLEDYYDSDEEERKKLIEMVRQNVDDIELYLANEIYISNNMIDLIKEKKASTINGTKYILFELPMNAKTISAKETIYRLIESGYVPIIAHPERYSYVQDRPEYVEELIEMGALFQSNYGSIIGLYGSKAKKTLKILLKRDLIHFFGSDVHKEKHIYTYMPKILKKLRKIISEEKLEELSELNAQKVLNNEDL